MSIVQALWGAAAATAVAAATAQPATYVIDPNHTFVTFEVPHFATSTNRGRFDRKSGSVVLDRKAGIGRVDITIDTGSINTGVEAFTRQLVSNDFFASAEYPTARFTADQMLFDGDRLREVSGQLTLRGKTHPVTLKATQFNCYPNPMLKREICGGDFEASLQRSLWGVNWGLAFGFADAVRLVIQVEAIRQE